MEFIRWVILSWEETLFEKGLIVPMIFITAIVVGFSYVINLILGAIITFLAILLWGLIGYVFISREVKEFYTEFEKSKARRGPKTPE